MKARLSNQLDLLLSSFWFVPALMVVAAIVLSGLTLLADTLLKREAISSINIIYSGGPDGARSLLSTVAGSVITVAGVTFSITIAALTLASSQFGPRLLRTFVRDRGNQVVLGTFIATFMYCLLVLRTIRQQNEQFNIESEVPNISVTVAVVLAIASLGVLIYYIHHVSLAIQAETIIAAVGSELDDALDRLFPDEIGRSQAEEPRAEGKQGLPADFERSAQPVRANRSGYLQVVDANGLMRLAVERDLLLRLEHRPGNFVVQGSALALISPGDRVDDDLVHAINAAVVMGRQRTPQQDIEFDINQLVEIAVRSLSPGINDPFTAIRCVDQLGVALSTLAGRDIPSPCRYDDNGRLRVVAEVTTFVGAANAAFDQVRQYGRTSVAVTIRMLEIIATILPRVQRSEDRAALLRQAKMIERGAQEALPEENDRADVRERYREVARIAADAA